MKSSKDDEISINKELQLKLKNLESDLERQKMLSIQAQSELSNTKQENKRLEDDNLKLQMEVKKMKTLSTQAQGELSDTKQECKRLKDDNLKMQTEIDKTKNRRESEIKGNKELQEKESLLEKNRCLERLKMSNIWKTGFYYGNNLRPIEHLSSSRFQVVSFGSFQDIVLKIDGLTILFDPYDTKVMEDRSLRKLNWGITDNIYNFEVDIVAISTCVYSFSDSAVRKIVQNNRNVKWIIPLEKEDWLISLGVDITSITVFGYWDEKTFNIRHRDISFVCTPTHINSVSSGNKLCNRCGWIVKGSTRTFYSAGFTNYNEPNFSSVKERHGPIHVALLPISDKSFNMSCSPEFSVEIDEILEMHTKLQPCTSLGIEACVYGDYCLENNRHILEKKMETLHLDCQRFQFLMQNTPYKID